MEQRSIKFESWHSKLTEHYPIYPIFNHPQSINYRELNMNIKNPTASQIKNSKHKEKEKARTFFKENGFWLKGSLQQSWSQKQKQEYMKWIQERFTQSRFAVSIYIYIIMIKLIVIILTWEYKDLG